MHKTSMRTQLNLSYLVISFVVVAVFSAIFYIYTSRILINQETERLETLTQTMLEQTESAIDAMDGVSVDIVYISLAKDRIKRILSDVSPASTGDEDAVWRRYQALSELGELLVAVNGSGLPVYRVNLYDPDGNCVSVGAANVVSSGIDLQAKNWYADAVDAGGSKVLTHAYLSAKMGSAESRPLYYISLVRLRLEKNRKAAGFIETIQRCSVVFSGVLALDSQEEQVYILDGDGGLVYPFDGGEAELHHANALLNSASTDTIACPITSAYTGWTYIVGRSEHVVLKPAYTLLRLILLLSLLMGAVIALYALLMSRRLTRPLLTLGERMNATDAHTLQGGEDAEAHSAGYKEIDSLNASFAQMRKQLNVSMNQLIETRQQALQSRNLAMQAQINPHFYFNTLSSIIALSDAGRSDDVVAMCRSLTGMMRYVTGSDPMTTLGEELNYVSRYLYCMQIRYEDSLSFTMDVPDALMQEPVPRLIIQPFVENALKHGIDCAPPWRLQIIGEIEPDCWRIWITDNGPGFSDQALKTIRKGMDALDRGAGMPDSHIGGMGVLNVYSRWKLFAGKDALFEIATRKDGGYAMIGKVRS